MAKERLVTVPGQRVRHWHTCKKCGHTWTHKAPTPMTEKVNDAIHTCIKCGGMRYEFDGVCMVQHPIILTALAGALILCLLLDNSSA